MRWPGMLGLHLAELPVWSRVRKAHDLANTGGRRIMSEKTFVTIAAVIFGLVALLHLLRIVMGWSIVIDAWTVLMWLSWIAFVVAGVLSYFGMRSTRG